MRTQIITLETHDDLISVRDRMSWAKTPRILLVWPKYEKIELRQVDLRILQRHASTLGAQLGLVTRQRRVRAEADALGIPVFESTGRAQRVAWPKKRLRSPRGKKKDAVKTLHEKREHLQVREETWRAHPATRFIAMLVGVLSVLAIVGLFIPRAQVKLNPLTRTQSVELPVTASPAVKSVFITGNIPALEKRIVVEGSQTILVTGQGTVPQSKAKGIVIFRNLTQNEVAIPAGTVVQGNGVRFATTEDGFVNAGVGKVLELPIEAELGGLSGNQAAEIINVIEGRLAFSLSVTNPEPTTGGLERASVQAVEADRMRVRDLLLKSLENDARANVLDELKSEDILFDRTLTLTQIISEVYDPPAGAAGSQLTLTMQVEFSILYASASDLTELAVLVLKASLPSGFSPASGKLTYESVTAPRLLDDGSIRWSVHAEREIIQQVDTAQVTQLIQGLSASSAQSRLEKTLPLMSEPKITMWPSWWPWVPIVPFRIEVMAQ